MGKVGGWPLIAFDNCPTLDFKPGVLNCIQRHVVYQCCRFDSRKGLQFVTKLLAKPNSILGSRVALWREGQACGEHLLHAIAEINMQEILKAADHENGSDCESERE